ncbi:carbon-nitrogen hydrolase family protein [Ferviditalea candida]|uniref:Carbon-nitrogen hydrolase family protein n=1 Tax=Ferviditalea candida TaxID=3108399 RepID=A0ABU5ZF39_9BACL|nr:carbon-nitrogen hydrolase family protein [Paenibacillaceae bacterium T2]
MQINIAAVQFRLKSIHSKEEFFRQVEDYIQQALTHEPHFIVFPELFTAELAAIQPKAPFEVVRDINDYLPDYLDFFTRYSKQYQVYIVAGTIIVKDDGGDYVNRAYLFRPDGTNVYQDKIHLTQWEALEWDLKQGNELHVFDTEHGKVSLLTCYDIEFPELSRYAVSKGAVILFSPSSTASRQGLYRVKSCAKARAIENQCFVVVTGTTGTIDEMPDFKNNFTTGGIYAPCDAYFPSEGVIAEGIENEEMIVSGAVDMEALHLSRSTLTNISTPLLKNMRNDLYSVEFKA